jgi:hypothetical protein
MASIIKADNIQKVSDGTNIIKKCGSTITLGSCGATISLACGATQTGFGQTYSAVAYCTTSKTSPFTAAAGTGYFINTTCGAVTVTLPASPTAGDVVAFKDYASQWNTNNVTLCNNGNKINGVCATANLNTQNQSVTLIYVDATKGWQDIQDSTSNVIGNQFIAATGGTITCCGNDRIHTFTSDGTFIVTKLACAPANNAVAYMVVGGGGYGSDYGNGSAGGGGAGGFREGKTNAVTPYTASPLAATTGLTVTATSFPITVGGGAGSNTGTNGTPSVFSTITATGGGRGAATGSQTGAPYVAAPGGSGGGGDGENNTGAGNGNTPPVSPSQGNNGGGGQSIGGNRAGGGGGGAGAAGTAGASTQQGGPGGGGTPTAITGSATFYAGGGGGQGQTTNAGTGGNGGGGAAGGPLGTAGNNGTANTGGGGGAGNTNNGDCGGIGGSGIVIIRYKFRS